MKVCGEIKVRLQNADIGVASSSFLSNRSVCYMWLWHFYSLANRPYVPVVGNMLSLSFPSLLCATFPLCSCLPL